MSNLVQRILLFLIMIPLLLFIIIVWTGPSHLIINLLTFLVTVGLTFESSRLVGLFPNPTHHNRPRKTVRIVSVTTIGSLPVIVAILITQGWLPFSALFASTICLILLVFAGQVIRTQWAKPSETLPQVLSYTFLVLYPGLLMAHLVTLSLLPYATELILALLGAVFINDTAAFVIGRIFGKFSISPIKVSPKKTLIGFLGGFVISPLIMFLIWYFNPAVFPSGAFSAIVIGVIIGGSTIIGDLFESALKRSTGMKDSGTIIPGRGGLLDSLDSTMYSAPIFFYVYVYSQNLWHLIR